MYLLDTNVISETRKASGNKGVRLWVAAQQQALLYVPSIAFLELQRGIEILHRQNPKGAMEISEWVDRLAMTARVLNFDIASAREYSRIRGHKRNFVSEDGMIAAIARTHRLILVTRNIKHFLEYDLELLDPSKQ